MGFGDTRPTSNWLIAFLVASVAWRAICPLAAFAGTVQDIRDRARLIVAVYKDFAPFSDDGQGIDVDVGKALAEKLGLTAEIMSFKDGETVDDDLRNVIWKGHFLWNQPLADVMMHVPVDQNLARKNDMVTILAPYFSEQLVVARNRNRIPQLVTLDALSGERVAVQFDTIEDHYLMNSFGGLLRENVVHFGTIGEAVAALRKNEVAAVMGSRIQIESSMAGAGAGYAIASVATPGLTLSGWDIGVAVNAANPELAALVDKAMAEMREDGTVKRIFTRRGLTYSARHGAGDE
jgi:polar amino acid transport system substrate-binding protein